MTKIIFTFSDEAEGGISLQYDIDFDGSDPKDPPTPAMLRAYATKRWIESGELEARLKLLCGNVLKDPPKPQPMKEAVNE